MIAYAITDPTTLDFQNLDQDLAHFSQHAKMILYRDKQNPNYALYAKRFIENAQKYTFDKILLHSNVVLASKLNADGVHLTSVQFDEIQRAKELNLFVVISTHTPEEVQKAEQCGADMVTFSPIFSTPNKGRAKGVEALASLVAQSSIPIIALGGILSSDQIALCSRYGAVGFASIRYFG